MSKAVVSYNQNTWNHSASAGDWFTLGNLYSYQLQKMVRMFSTLQHIGSFLTISFNLHSSLIR